MKFHRHKNNSIVMVSEPAWLYGKQGQMVTAYEEQTTGGKPIHPNRENPNNNIYLTLHHKHNNKLLDKTIE